MRSRSTLLRRRGDVATTHELDETRRVDIDARGEPIGVDLTNVSDGIRLDGLPRNDESVQMFRSFATIVTLV